MRTPFPSWTREALREAAWAPTLVFLLHLFLCFVLRAYVPFPYLDVPMHLLGGVAIVFFFNRCLASFLRGTGRPPLPAPLDQVLLASLTATAAVCWEFAEYLTDRLLGTRAQLGLEDTLLDLVCGILGGLAFLLAARRPRDAHGP